MLIRVTRLHKNTFSCEYSWKTHVWLYSLRSTKWGSESTDGLIPRGSVGVKLSDSKGQERIRLVVDADDVPRMEFLNEKGEVIYSLPPKQQD